MKKIIRYANTVVMLSVLTFLAAKNAITRRFAEVTETGDDRGEIPGWAIASAAACVLGAVVYAAYSTVINKWVGKIN